MNTKTCVKDEIMRGISYNGDYYYRDEKAGGNYKEVFNRSVNYLTNEPFLPNNWKGSQETETITKDDIKYCICGHDVGELYFITHRSKGICIGVGSSCIEKIDKKLWKQLTHELCSMCNENALDLRTTLGKAGFCDYQCQYLNRVGNWECKFKKYKGKTYNEVLQKDVKYIEWLYENIVDLHKGIIQWIELKLRKRISP